MGYGDNYWTEQGQGGVAGGGNAYAESGNNSNPAWANEPEPEIQQQSNNDYATEDYAVEAPKKAPKKKSNAEKKSLSCCSERLKKYTGLWSCFFVMAFIGILLLIANNNGVSTPGLLIFFIGFLGFGCSTYCFCKFGD